MTAQKKPPTRARGLRKSDSYGIRTRSSEDSLVVEAGNQHHPGRGSSRSIALPQAQSSAGWLDQQAEAALPHLEHATAQARALEVEPVDHVAGKLDAALIEQAPRL
jgi:hypothetical protein